MRWPLLSIGLLVTGATLAADDLEPAVKTSDAAAEAAPPAKTGPGRAAAGHTAARPPTANPVAASGGGKAQDRLQLDPTQITGNKELPRQMFVVPWKRPNLGDFTGRPPNSLLDEVLAPVDRDVFRRQNRYFAALKPDTPAPASGPASESATATSGDEK